MEKMMIYCPKYGWNMSYDQTVQLVCDDFFEHYGAKITKSSVRIVAVNEIYETYEGGDHDIVNYIEFYVCPPSTGRKYRYSLCLNSGWIEKR